MTTMPVPAPEQQRPRLAVLRVHTQYPDRRAYLHHLLADGARWPGRTDIEGIERAIAVGQSVLEIAEAGCACKWDMDAHLWLPCPEHPASCQEPVLWSDGAVIGRCGIPVPAGHTRCPVHR